jgi:hypothetical protein
MWAPADPERFCMYIRNWQAENPKRAVYRQGHFAGWLLRPVPTPDPTAPAMADTSDARMPQ